MASHGQRFRRRSLRRGYKVDEVDAFLDRVEATLAGEPIGDPVTAQEIHDVVFRVQFNGYDEWQVDLHLDRLERQIAEMEERGALGRPEPSAEQVASVPPPPPMPPQEPRNVPPAPPMPPRPASAAPSRSQYGGYDEPTGSFSDGYGVRPGGYDVPQSVGYDVPQGGGYGSGYEASPVPAGRGLTGPGGPGAPVGSRPGFGREESFDGFAAGRHSRADMTSEIRMPEPDPLGPPRGPVYGAPPPHNPTGPLPMGGAPAGGRVTGFPSGPISPTADPLTGPSTGPLNDLQFVDKLRRSFQVRRFGSGYDPGQVDRLFDGILAAMAGRGPMPVNPGELDAMRFDLVPGGYYEAEVDAALRQVKDLLRGR